MRVQRPWRGKGLEDEKATQSRTDRAEAARGRRTVLSSGATIADVCIELEVSEATYHRWRKQYSGMELQTLKRLKALEQENARLKRIVADQVIDISILKEVAEGNF